MNQTNTAIRRKIKQLHKMTNNTTPHTNERIINKKNKKQKKKHGICENHLYVD